MRTAYLAAIKVVRQVVVHHRGPVQRLGPLAAGADIEAPSLMRTVVAQQMECVDQYPVHTLQHLNGGLRFRDRILRQDDGSDRTHQVPYFKRQGTPDSIPLFLISGFVGF